MAGKFLRLGDEKLCPRGATYGAFEPNADGVEYHDLGRVDRDFAAMSAQGFDAVRIPHTMPPVSLLDAAERHGLHVMVGLAAEQYAGYLADGRGGPNVERIVREKVRAVAGHPAILCYALGNEIPAPLVRWTGRRKVERYLERLCDAVKEADPGGLVTYVNYPTTEYLELPFLDLLSFNVYLEQPDRLDAYLARLHGIAGDRPLLMSEIGLDALRNGEDTQAEVLDWQIRRAFASGCAGAFVFSWTDEWFRAGEYVDDWAFGLTRRDRSPKPALAAVSTAFAEYPFPEDAAQPRISVVVCTYNGAPTLGDTLAGIARLDYPDYEVVVVDDGSSDCSAALAEAFGARVVRTANGGLSSARNVGAGVATGEIVAYLDDDAWPDPHWLRYLADTFERTDAAAVGGPNIAPRAPIVAESVAHSPGGPVHVLLSDTEAEHIPGCNFAIRKEVLERIGGFDPQFRAAGDDVDLCWRLQDEGLRIGLNPAAMVWHHRRGSVRAYWRQQRGYGRAEALLERKWPHRFNAAGHVSWAGQVYGNAFARFLSARRSRVYGGVWGMAPFQSLYAASPALLDSLARLPEWYLVIGVLAGLCALGAAWPPLLWAAPLLALAVLLPAADALHAGLRTRFSPRRRSELWRLRITTAFLHLTQPLARLTGRIGYGLSPWKRRRPVGLAVPRRHELAVWCEDWQPPEDRLAEAAAAARATGLALRAGGPYDSWDIEARAGTFGGARALFAVEDHGAGTQYVRVRISPRPSWVALGIAASLLALAAGAALDDAWGAGTVLALVGAALLAGVLMECASAVAVIRRSASGAESPTAAGAGAIGTALLDRAHGATVSGRAASGSKAAE